MPSTILPPRTWATHRGSPRAEWYCQANRLAMIARQHGAETTTAHCSFLMGFTYGAVEIPGQVGFSPFSDPEPGFGVAAPYFGLVRRYLVSRDPDLDLRVLRTFLARGIAVRIALDELGPTVAMVWNGYVFGVNILLQYGWMIVLGSLAIRRVQRIPPWTAALTMLAAFAIYFFVMSLFVR